MAEKTEDQLFALNYTRRLDEVLKNDPSKSVKDADDEAKTKATEDTKTQMGVYIRDREFYRRVSKYLAIIVVIVILCSTLLIGLGKSPTDGLIAIGSGAVGALIGLFTAQK